jgi:hypothetical protein
MAATTWDALAYSANSWEKTGKRFSIFILFILINVEEIINKNDIKMKNMTCLTSVSKPLLADHAHTAIKVIPITTGGVSGRIFIETKETASLIFKEPIVKKNQIYNNETAFPVFPNTRSFICIRFFCGKLLISEKYKSKTGIKAKNPAIIAIHDSCLIILI